jgi:hypothetical protein
LQVVSLNDFLMNQTYIPVFVINLESRRDRKEHILQQFHQKGEFDVHVVDACEHNNGAIGLWNSIAHILQNLVKMESDYILLCEDDHQFTDKYSKEHLFECIAEAKEKEADILSGGISWFKDGIQISRDLFWVEKFTGLQFTIIFKKFFDKILQANFSETDVADFKISSLSENKLLIYPFISTQKEFGYSDVTIKNNQTERVERIFDESAKRLQLLSNVASFYKTSQKE